MSEMLGPDVPYENQKQNEERLPFLRSISPKLRSFIASPTKTIFASEPYNPITERFARHVASKWDATASLTVAIANRKIYHICLQYYSFFF